MVAEIRKPIYWKGHLVGYVTDFEMDMWYQGGKWEPEQSEYLPEFYNVLSGLLPIVSMESINTNLEKRIWVGLGINEPTHLVYTFDDNRIDMRITPSIKPESW
ncbi:MAG: hypothetical protein K8I60_02205 [Anaerolineae bacterium]|nr:hypothetical protein [Anaerolineae bacterium]